MKSKNSSKRNPSQDTSPHTCNQCTSPYHPEDITGFCELLAIYKGKRGNKSPQYYLTALEINTTELSAPHLGLLDCLRV